MHIGPTKRDPMLGSGERPRSTSIGLTRCRTSGSQSRQLGDSARRDAALLSARTRTTANAPEPSHSSARSRLDGTLALATSESRRSRQLDVDRVIAFAAAGRRTCCRAAFAMPRQQPSGRARRTAASPRLRGSPAARTGRRPPRYSFAREGIARRPSPPRSLRLIRGSRRTIPEGDQTRARPGRLLARRRLAPRRRGVAAGRHCECPVGSGSRNKRSREGVGRSGARDRGCALLAVARRPLMS